MSDLPLVLAGPIVRRVESSLATFWIALREPAEITVHVWQGGGLSGTNKPGTVEQGQAAIASSVKTPTRRIAQNLHVAVVLVKPTGPLLPGGIFSYDLSFGGKTLRSLGMLADEVKPDASTGRVAALALGYAPGLLPTFRTPVVHLEDVRLVHGSCRGASRPGYDAMAWLDDLLEKTLTDPSERPQQLFLTGDQIYADDLGPELLWMLDGIAQDLIGNELFAIDATGNRHGETLRVDISKTTGTPKICAYPVNRVYFPPGLRLKFVRETAAFSTSDGDSHLLSFAEFAAMHLAVWNPRIWRPLGNAVQVFPAFNMQEELKDRVSPIEEKELEDRLTPIEKAFAKDPRTWSEDAKKQKAFNDILARTKLFRDLVPKVARALANIATYMIFDDHEVTDDWNLSKKWQNRVYSHETGPQIISNAVMAYAVFQGWGNDPARFESGKNKDVLDEITRLFSGPGPYPVAPFETIKILTTVTGAPPDQRPIWHYTVSSNLYAVIVLDTRTRRSFEGQGLGPPDLIGENRDQQIPAGPFTDGRQLLFLVSAAPVLGPEAIESLGWPLAAIIHDVQHAGKDLESGKPGAAEVGVEKRDLEGWAANAKAREALLKRIATYPCAVIFAGDVHYSYSMVLDYYRKGMNVPSRIINLTSSPLRNEFKEIVNAVVRMNALAQTLVAGFSAAVLGWNAPPTLTFPPNALISPGRKAKLRRTPAFALSRGWPPGTSIPPANPPDWSWRARLLRDTRPDTAIPSARQPLNLLPTDEFNPGDPLHAYHAEAGRHQQSAVTHYDLRRQLVFSPAIGLVKISKSGSAFTLTHTLLSEDAPDSVTSAANTVHEVALTPGAKPDPADPAPGSEPAPPLETR